MFSLQCHIHNCPDLARHMSGLSLQGVSVSITHIQAVQYISHVHACSAGLYLWIGHDNNSLCNILPQKYLR